ncbi:MAG: glycosyltransferase family 1 protein [Paludibacter sp.]|nr:glycosyltransferase family 1 protein [Paludibacter sp.]
MRIGFDAKRLFCNHRGLGNYSRDLIRILNQYYPENQYDLFTPEVKIDFPINSQNTQIIQPSGIYKVLPSSIWRSIGIKSDIKKHGDDIFHGLSQELPIGIEKIPIKKVITFHDAIFIRYPELYPASYRKIFTAKNMQSCRISDKIIAISEQSRQDAIEFFKADPTKVEVVYQGCNNIFRQKATVEEKDQIKSKYNLPTDYLLFVGAIEPRKNLATILQAIYQEKIDIPLVVVGRQTNYTAELRELSIKLKLSNRVFFLHQVETKDLPAIYQLAQLFIYPSIFEGFGIPILEALCSETPVITSTGSCFEETGGEFSQYVDPQNAQEIGTAIVKVLQDLNLQKTMKKQGLIHAEKFTDDKIADNLMNLYNSI